MRTFEDNILEYLKIVLLLRQKTDAPNGYDH